MLLPTTRRHGTLLLNAALCAAMLCLSALASRAAERPRAPGACVARADPQVLAKSAFRKDQAVVGTYYFYWYDSETKEHFVNGDGTDALTDHPTNPKGYSYRSPDWHLRELRDILDAGLDFILPVYWGFPEDYRGWSFAGLPPLVEACRRLENEGRTPPRIGLFYDTSTLQWNSRGFHADLATPEGKEWLYVSARDFFSLVPPDLWATIEGRPLLWLYAAGFAKRQDPAALDHLRAEFEKDFGVRPFVVKEVSWQGSADATYAWGGAIRPTIFGVAAVGPGYDHSAVPGRVPLVVDREGGAFYSRSWEWVLSRAPDRRPKLAVVETWNELHEGTEIAPTREHGRLYVELTRRYATLWKAGKRAERSGKYGKAREVSIALGGRNDERGLAQRESADGKTEPVRLADRDARRTVKTENAGRYVYFDVDDAFYHDEGEPLEVEFEALDDGGGSLMLEYDSTDHGATLDGAFKAAPPVQREDSGKWRTVRIGVGDAAFVGRSNGFDFRISATTGDVTISKVTVRKVGTGSK